MTNEEKFKEVFGFIPSLSGQRELCPRDFDCEEVSSCTDCPFNEDWWKREFEKAVMDKLKEESEQSEETPWYLNVFNPTVLKEFQKRMRDATPEESQEVPYNAKGSSIHSEVYKCGMPIDEETIKNEILNFLEYYTRSELLNIVIEAIEMYDSIEEKKVRNKK